MRGIKAKLEAACAALQARVDLKSRGQIAGIFDQMGAIAIGVMTIVIIIGLALLMLGGIKNAGAGVGMDVNTSALFNASMDTGIVQIAGLNNWVGIMVVAAVVVLLFILVLYIRGGFGGGRKGR